MSYKATLIKGKTFNCGKYIFDSESLRSQTISDEFLILLEKSGKFEFEKIEESRIAIPEIIKIDEPKIFVLIDWIEEATGYGNIGKKLLEKYSGVIKYEQKGPEFKDTLNLKDIPHESHVIQLTTPNCFKELDNIKKRIGFTMFETTKIPPDWPEICNKTCDILIVPSEENKKVFKNCGVTVPIKTIPLWVDDSYKYYNRPKRKTFTFLFVGGIDSHNRKGWYELHEAFKQEFKDEKDVRLIFKCLYLNIHEAMVTDIQEDDRVSFVKGKLKNKDLQKLYKKADCFVFPTHGEGFGLPPLEAMSTGLPTIVTDWMGCKEFVDSKICYPLKVDKLEEALFPDTYGDVGDWAYVSIKEIRKQMRYVYEHQKEAKEKGKLAAKVVNDRFRFKHFTEALDRIVELDGKNVIKSKKALKLNLICEGLTFGYTGFAEAMRNLSYSLYDKGCNVTTKPHDIFELDKPECIISASVDILNTKKGRILNSLTNVVYDNNYKTVHITMTVPLGVARDKNAYQIGYVMFETQKIPNIFIDSLMKNTDELWVPSSFNLKNFTKAGYSKPIFTMPLGVDTDRFNPDKVEPLVLGLQDKFTFLTIVGWSERKGISILVQAFLREFNKNDNVILYLKGGWYDYEQAKKEVAHLTSLVGNKNPPEIKVDFKLYSNELLPRLYKSVDCFILASLGEGWGLNCTEAMSMGLPTIGSRSTSLVDFMNDKNSFLIDIAEYRPEPSCDWICGDYIGQKFAIPSIEHLQKQMREVYENKKLAKEKGEQARKDMVEKYQWGSSADRWFKRLKELEGKL